MTLYDRVKDALIQEAEYRAERDYNDSIRQVKSSFGKRGFSRKPPELNRALRLTGEAYADTIRATTLQAVDKVNQLQLQKYESDKDAGWQDVLSSYKIRQIDLQEQANILKLNNDTDTSTQVENLKLANEIDVNAVEILYKRIVAQINAQGDAAQALESSRQKILTEKLVSIIGLDSEKATQGIELSSEAAAKLISFDHEKVARLIKLQADIDTSIAEANASNNFAVDELNAKVAGSLLKDAARLQAVTNEGDAQVDNAREISATRVEIATQSGQKKLEASGIVHDARLTAFQNKSAATLINIFDENAADLIAIKDNVAGKFAATQLIQQARLDALAEKNSARLDNIIAKSNQEVQARQAILTAKLSNSQSETTARLQAIKDINSADLQSQTRKAESSLSRATDNATAHKEATALRNSKRLATMRTKMEYLASYRQRINSAEFSALVASYQSSLDAIQVKGENRLVTSQIIELARLSNAIAETQATLESRSSVNKARTDANARDIDANNMAASIRSQADAWSSAINQANRAQDRIASTAVGATIDVFNAFSQAQIAVQNRIQYSTTYSTSE